VAPQLAEPADEATVSWPNQPLVLRWNAVNHATKYLVSIATDPGLSNLVLGNASKPPETQGTVFAFPSALARGGPYYWAVTPVDAEGNKGQRSDTATFYWDWPFRTIVNAPTDINDDAEVVDPMFSWQPVPGAARYQVEVNDSGDWAVGSKVCCDEATVGTALSPTKVLAHDTGVTGPGTGYHWRVRAIDADGNSGTWTEGPMLEQTFDDVGIKNLRVLVDAAWTPATDQDPTTPTPEVAAPVLTWDPVPGASSYNVQVAPYDPVIHCNWTADSPLRWNDVTAATRWTPLSSLWNNAKPGGVSYTRMSKDTPHLIDGTSYCARVSARRDRDAKNREVVGPWTSVGGNDDTPDFSYKTLPYTAPSGPLRMASTDYLSTRETQTGKTDADSDRRLPLFRWQPIPGARSYFVVVAKDRKFTNIQDLAITNVPAYAPRYGSAPATYPDETTSYYWAVVPATDTDGNGSSYGPVDQHTPNDGFAATFNKQSVPPQLVTPHAGEVVGTQATFRWRTTEGARNYRLQVAQDPGFNDLIDDVTTASTMYTATKTYPADTDLYWRVRANDETTVGLTWSTSSFRHVLPVPQPASDNRTSADVISKLSWQPVDGAVSYDVHVDQPDGTKKDFTVRSTSFTPTAHYGTGIWRLKVRANFPAAGSRTVSGGYSPSLDFLRHINAPDGVKAIRTATRVLVTWNPDPASTQYRVEVADNDSFTNPIESVTTDNTSWAPDLTRTGYRRGGRIYWRVALVDSGRNVGAYASGSFTLPRTPGISSSGSLRRGHRGTFTVRVKTAAGRALRKAKVTVSGAGVTRVTRRTGKKGTATFRVRPRRKGSIAVRVQARGYRTTTVKMPVV